MMQAIKRSPLAEWRREKQMEHRGIQGSENKEMIDICHYTFIQTHRIHRMYNTMSEPLR